MRQGCPASLHPHRLPSSFFLPHTPLPPPASCGSAGVEALPRPVHSPCFPSILGSEKPPALGPELTRTQLSWSSAAPRRTVSAQQGLEQSPGLPRGHVGTVHGQRAPLGGGQGHLPALDSSSCGLTACPGAQPLSCGTLALTFPGATLGRASPSWAPVSPAAAQVSLACGCPLGPSAGGCPALHGHGSLASGTYGAPAGEGAWGARLCLLVWGRQSNWKVPGSPSGSPGLQPPSPGPVLSGSWE